MIKKFGKGLSKGFDTDQENIDRVTVKDGTVGAPIVGLVLWILFLPLTPLFVLMAVFQWVAALLILASAIGFSVSIYAIFDGRGDWLMWLVVMLSTLILGGYFLVFPVLQRHPIYAKLKDWIEPVYWFG